MNTTGYAKEDRACLSPGELVRMFGVSAQAPPTVDGLALLAGALEDFTEAELVGLYADCSELAARLDLPAEVRRLAAIVASVTEEIVASGLADWSRIEELIEAGQAVTQTKGTQWL